MWNASPEKIELLFELASRRVTREAAIEDLRLMEVLNVTNACLVGGKDNKGPAAFGEMQRRLRKIAGIKAASDERKNRKEFLARLSRFGAQVVNG